MAPPEQTRAAIAAAVRRNPPAPAGVARKPRPARYGRRGRTAPAVRHWTTCAHGAGTRLRWRRAAVVCPAAARFVRRWRGTARPGPRVVVAPATARALRRGYRRAAVQLWRSLARRLASAPVRGEPS